ncbi:MAG: hypothetical protein AAF989_05645 [Planctomycetota bacterium]
MYEEPWLTERIPQGKRLNLLRIWGAGHCQDHGHASECLGGKHPLLCLLGPELSQAWNQPTVVAVDRDPNETVRSLVRRGWGWPVEACMMVTEQLISARELFLASYEGNVVRIAYERLLHEPNEAITDLASQLGLSVSEESIADAARHVAKHAGPPDPSSNSRSRAGPLS